MAKQTFAPSILRPTEAQQQAVIEASPIPDSRYSVHLYHDSACEYPYLLPEEIRKVLTLKEFALFVKCFKDDQYIYPIEYFDFITKIDEAK